MRRSAAAVVVLTAVAAFAVLASSGCATRYEPRDPLGERFPSVTGEALSGEAVRVPEDFAGRPLLLLIGFDQDAQFDVDRWLLGLLQGQVDVAVRELPTIPGFVPRLFSGTIDAGMRAGIPSEDWGAVVTVYGDGDRIARFTGSERDNNTRVVLLDGDGKVAFFHDRGYSAGVLLRLKDAVEALQAR
ncbi:MAG: hypothetical protein IPM29_05675 [Planctomycetes bacterium]|nr:hypothetical protein [Planctomycetota bacterium]